MNLIKLPQDVINLIAEYLSPVDAFRLFKTCRLFLTYYQENHNKRYEAIIMDSFTKGNQGKSIKSLKNKQYKMIENLINGHVKTVNLFNCFLLEPNFKIIKNDNATFTLWQNQIVQQYRDNMNDSDSDIDIRFQTHFPLLTKEEYDDLFLLDFAPAGLLEVSSVENTILDTSTIEPDSHMNHNDECVMQIIPMGSSIFKNQSNIYFQQDIKSILKSKTLVNKLYVKYPQTSAIIDKPLNQFSWENVRSTEVKDGSRTSNWILPVNFSKQLYDQLKNHKMLYGQHLTFSFLNKRRKRKRNLMLAHSIKHGDLFTPEKFLKFNEITSGKYLISVNLPGNNSGKNRIIVIKCYKKINIDNVHAHDQLQSMVWQAEIQSRYNIGEKLGLNLGLFEYDTLSIPTFLKIQISDFYTLIPVKVQSLHGVDIYYWLVFKTPNGEYLGKYKINYDLNIYGYRVQTFRMPWNERYQINTYLVIPQIIMIGSNLFKIHYNWKMIDDGNYKNVSCVDNFQLLWIPLINFLDMLDDKIENYQKLKIVVKSSRFFNSNGRAYSDNDHNDDGGNYDWNWRTLIETPKIDILQPLINIEYPDYKIKGFTVDPYFWNNNNIAIKVKYYLEAIFDPNYRIMDSKIFEYLILYDIEINKWKFISLNNPLVDYNSKNFLTLIIDNKLNFVVLGKDSISIPIYN